MLVVTGVSIAPPNAALRKILSEKSPIVASMTEKPQILGLYMSKKQYSYLLLTVFFVLPMIFCLFCFSFFFAHRCQSS